MIRIITFYVPVTPVMRLLAFVWRNTGSRVRTAIPTRLRIPSAALLAIAVIVVGALNTRRPRDGGRGLAEPGHRPRRLAARLRDAQRRCRWRTRPLVPVVVGGSRRTPLEEVEEDGVG